MAVVGCSSSESAAGNAATSDGSGPYKIVEVNHRQTAPTLQGTPISGERQISLQRLQGQVVVINFWASWCGPCRAESPILEHVLQMTSTQGVSFVGINEKDSRSAAVAFARDNRVSYPSVFDPDGSVAARWPSAPGLPYTFILDRKGRIAVRIIGGVTKQQLQSAVLRLTSEATAA